MALPQKLEASFWGNYLFGAPFCKDTDRFIDKLREPQISHGKAQISHGKAQIN